MQQSAENQLINRLLLKFQVDQSQATRQVLQLIVNDPNNTIHYLTTFNQLLNSKCMHSRQRRDVAAIARLIADSQIFTHLQKAVSKDILEGRSTDPGSLTIQVTKLISNICNENPHFIDNILSTNPFILYRLFITYSNEDTTPNDPECITVILNFLHNISLKETSLRNDKVGPCLEALLQNLLTKNKFCPFISNKKFQSFISSLFKFHSNVNLVAHHVYYSLMKAARSLNNEYKRLAELYKAASQRTASASQRTAVMQGAGFADKKLIAIMRLFEKARGNIFVRFDAYSFIGFLKILVKTAIMRPVAMINQPHENKGLINLIHDLMMSIQEYQIHIQTNKILPQSEKNEQKNEELGDEEEVQIQVPMQQQKEVFSARQIQRFKHQSQRFKSILEVSKSMSDAYLKTIKTTIQNLSLCFTFIRIDSRTGLHQIQQYYIFLINILTVRLQRLLSWMVRLFPTEQLKSANYYSEIVLELLKLLMPLFQCAIWAQTNSVMQQVDKIEDASIESEGSSMRYIMYKIDQQAVKTHIQNKLVEKTNIFSTAYEAILRFGYHLIDQPKNLRQNMTEFIHKFIHQLRQKYLTDITESKQLGFRQIETLRLMLRVVSQFFPHSILTLNDEMERRLKVYDYCLLVQQQGNSENNLFMLLADVLNNLQKHETQKTIELQDSQENRVETLKTIFTKIATQKAKIFIHTIVNSHQARVGPDFKQKDIQQIRQYYQHVYSGYFAYVKCINAFIKRTCAGDRSVLYKQQILGNVLDRTLEYSLFVEDTSPNRVVESFYVSYIRRNKKVIDQQANVLLEWIFENTHKYLHRLPLLLRRVLHFQRRQVKAQDEGNTEILEQQQIAHIFRFIQSLSYHLTKTSLILTGKRLDLKIKIKQPKIKLGEQVNIGYQLQRLSNYVIMVSQCVKLMTNQQYFQPNRPQISPNYFYSLLKLIREVLSSIKLRDYKKEVNQLIHGSVWMIEVYLTYSQYIKIRHAVLSKEKKAQYRRSRRLRKKEQSKKKKYHEHFTGQENLESNTVKQSKKKKPKNKKRKQKQVLNEQQQQEKGLSKNESMKNILLDQSQVKCSNVSSKPQRKSGKNSYKQMQKVIHQYLHTICHILGSSDSAIIKKDTLSYILYFICRNMKKNIGNKAPYTSFQVKLGEIMGDLLNIKVDQIKIEGFHVVLAKIGLQLFDEAHIKVDYQLAIKRYFYQHIDTGIQLGDFLEMLKESFKEISNSTAQLVEIVCYEGEGENLTVTKYPFIKANYKDFSTSTGKKYKVQLKQGVELHLVNFKTDPKRKPSANEQNKTLKASDYYPEIDLFTFIEQIITNSIHKIFKQLDKSFTYEAFQNQINYQTQLEPFTIRSILQTLHYLARESPSLGPFIARFKCKKIILNEINGPSLKNKPKVTAFVMRLLTGSAEYNQNMQQIGFLSVLLRLFSPTVGNVISGMIFQLCLDSTPLIQVCDSKTGKNGYLPFSSVVRAKVVEQIENILFEKVEMGWLFRKLFLLNLVTVLTNIREMSKLFIQNGYISKIFKAFQSIKKELDNCSQKHQMPLLLNSSIIRIMTPFYLSPLSILQQVNIFLHLSKKKNESKKIVIKTVLDGHSINSQLIPSQALKKYKFKEDWPFHVRRNVNIMEAHQDQDNSDSPDQDNLSSHSDISQSYESIDSSDEDNSSFLRYQQLMDHHPQGDDLDSYISMSQPHQQQLFNEWDYSNQQDRNQYPHRQDRVVQLSISEDDDRFQDSDDQDDSDREDIQHYINQQLMENRSREGGSIIDGLSISQSNLQHDNQSMIQPQEAHNNQFTVTHVDELEYYNNVNTTITFQRIQSILRISKAEKKQVHLLRFFLQILIFNKRKAYNKSHERIMSSHQNKQQKLVEDNLSLIYCFGQDQHIKYTEFIEYNQIYRYDHFQKELPKLSEEIQKDFMDYIETTRHPYRRRGGFIHEGGLIHQRPNLIQIIPGWNVTEVVNQDPNQSNSLSEDDNNSYFRRLQERGVLGRQISSSQSHIHIQSQESQQPQNFIQQHQQINLEQILRHSNLGMSARQFLLLDRQLQRDILLNLAQQAQILRPANNTPVQQEQEINLMPLPLQENQMNPMENQQNREIVAQEDPIQQMEIQAQQPQQLQPEPQIPQQNTIINRVDQVYRKMSVQHSKKVSKDVIQALNKQGKNDSKFYQIEESELQRLLEVFFVSSQMDHSKFPYPLIESLCINTRNLSKIVSNLIMILHLTPSIFSKVPLASLINVPIAFNQCQFQHFSQTVYSSNALKILHLLTHLTKSYSISMSLLQINKDTLSCLTKWQLEEQSQLSSFEMLIKLLKQKKIAHSPMNLSFLIGVLDNITMHYFYKNVHKIVQKGKEKHDMENEQVQAIKISEDSVYQLGELLQSDFVGNNLTHVSKIIMRLSVQEHNLHNFINYLQQLVKNLTDQALEQVINYQVKKEEIYNPLKIVNIMSIFYQMVKAFQTYPTSSERHLQVLGSLRKIVEYDKLQELCERAMKILFQSTSKQTHNKIGELIDCFAILHQIAMITSTTPKKTTQDIHNNIAELGQIVQLRRSQVSQEQTVYLGRFNPSKLWKQSINNPNFKLQVNNNIKRKMSEAHGRRIDPLEMPIIKLASETPHLMSFDNKHAIFKMQLKRLRGKDKYEMIHILLKRQDVFEASFQNFMSRSADRLKGKLKIDFEDEQGEDAGGVTREWFQLLSREMFNPNYGLFRSGSGGHTYHPSSTSYYNERHLDYFKFIGRIAGKALYDGYLLDAYFTPAFYKHILNVPITYQDMQQQDYEYFKSLTWILQNSPIEEYLQLTFTYDCDNFGEIKTKELIANGGNILVTEQNKMQYVQLIAYAKMATSVKLQLQAFLTGLHELIPHRLLRIFSEKELEIMISGRPTIDIEDLRRNTELVNYMRNDPIIVWLFEVLQAFDMELRTAFIQFVTGSSRVPVQGFKDLRGMNGVQRFNIHRQFQEERLPRAHTCFNQLDLPNYRSKEILIEKLMYAITEGKEGFGMI